LLAALEVIDFSVIHKLKYRVLTERLAVCRAAADTPIPDWVQRAGFFCVTRGVDELSIVCPEDRARDQAGLRVEPKWVAFRLEGPFPFSMTGVLASFVQPLADAGVPIFAISTFDTDYVLVKVENLTRAQAALNAAGHEPIA
jgi:hypothetical protein